MIVLLSCGHWFSETRPGGTESPRQGEYRSCGVPEHYPRQFPAVYVEGDV